MATLILGTVGRIVAGPIGAIVGTLVGSGIDRAVLGAGRPREQGRVSNPAVQSATYGEPIPIIVGRMRAAGNLIWTSGIRESAATSGGGKRSGPATTTYSYSASFAVGLVGHRIAGVERIWADGKLIREAAGVFAKPVTMRLHTGDADQPLDPLIASAETSALTPAYRGLAYAVFEDLPLADYGNRIPNLTFELVADVTTVDAGDAIRSVAAAARFGSLRVEGAFPALTGYIAARAGSLGEALAPLIGSANAAVVGADPITIIGRGGVPAVLSEGDFDAHRSEDPRAAERQQRTAADSQPASVDLAFYDVSRDYQPGLQRARWSAVSRSEQQSIAAALTPEQAKALVFEQLATGIAARSRRSLRLPWRHVGIRPGAVIRFEGDSALWRVREARFENFIVFLDLERLPAMAAAPLLRAAHRADGGRAVASEIAPVGPTTVVVLDLPPLPGDLPSAPRLWIAGNGAEPGWRRAGVMFSLDGGDSFVSAGVLEGGTVIGTALTALRDGACYGWDRSASVDVELLAERDWLERRSPTAVLAGANLALLGQELIQFLEAEALGPRQFRLRGLLRGRRGTEAATADHAIGERFVLIDPARMLPLDFPLETLGRQGQVRGTGTDDGNLADVPFTVGGRSLRPLSPVHVVARWLGSDLVVSWIRRSRAGFGWTDFVDAPLAEETEAYRVEVLVDGRIVRHAVGTQPCWVYSAADRAGDGNPTEVTVAISQLSRAVGPGTAATIHIELQA